MAARSTWLLTPAGFSLSNTGSIFILIALFGKTWSQYEDYDLTALDCNQDEYFHSDECYVCPVCPAGSGLPSHCGFGEGRNLSCEPCTGDLYNSLSDGRQCLPCLDCSMYLREYKYKCRAKVNSECGACLPGYFDSYKDAIDKDNLYPCTTCRMRPNEPECLQTTPAPVPNGAPTTPSTIPRGSQTGKRSDKSTDDDKGGDQHQQPGERGGAIDSSPSLPKPSYVMAPDTSDEVPRGLTKSTTAPPTGGGTDVIAAAVSGAVVVVALIIVVLIIWRVRKSERMCAGTSRRQESEDNTTGEKQQEDGSIPLQPLITKPDAQPGDIDRQVSAVAAGEQGKALLQMGATEEDDNTPTKKGYCVVNIPPCSSCDIDVDIKRNDPKHSDNSHTARSDTPAGGAEGGRKSSNSENGRHPRDRSRVSPTMMPTVVFNGPTILNIKAQQIGHHQTLNRGENSTRPSGANPRSPVVELDNSLLMPLPESSQRQLPSALCSDAIELDEMAL